MSSQTACPLGASAECGSDILNMVFSCQQLWCLYRTEGFRRYLLEADHTAAVGFHHDFLQHIQWGDGGRHWALKITKRRFTHSAVAQITHSGAPT